MYKLTKIGRNRASSIMSDKRDPILDFLYTHKLASLDELCSVSGLSSIATRRELSKFARAGLVEKIGEVRSGIS